jgi:hypothetical protein
MKIGHPFETAIQLVSQHVSGRFPATLPECQQEYNEILKKIKELERDTVSSRIKEQQQNLEMRLMQADKAGAMAIRNIMKAEAINRNHSTEYCKTCTSWKTLEDPVEVQAALQQRNQIHFGQAKGTFRTTPLFSNHVDWMASTIAADMILEGHDHFSESTDIPDIVRELLASFKHSSPLDAVSEEVTVSEWVGKMKTWKETTSQWNASGTPQKSHQTIHP